MPSQLMTGLKVMIASGAMLFVALLPQRVYAALGGPESGVIDDASVLKGSIKSTERANYRVHEIQLSSGTVLREFAGTGGTVFAVAWRGPTIPNLRQALGHYFDAFVTVAQSKHAGGRTHLEIRQNEWVMQSSGHMRAFQGRAYLPQSLPAGVTLDEIH
jgi:hypothetical protein